MGGVHLKLDAWFTKKDRKVCNLIDFDDEVEYRHIRPLPGGQPSALSGREIIG
jgi:hypothetical protein